MFYPSALTNIYFIATWKAGFKFRMTGLLGCGLECGSVGWAGLPALVLTLGGLDPAEGLTQEVGSGPWGWRFQIRRHQRVL